MERKFHDIRPELLMAWEIRRLIDRLEDAINEGDLHEALGTLREIRAILKGTRCQRCGYWAREYTVWTAAVDGTPIAAFEGYECLNPDCGEVW